MDFGTLVVIVLAGLGGPLLGVVGHRFVPVVIGEILAGVLVGPSLLGVVDPADPTVAFLAQVGFAMLMLTVGMHLPLRDRRLRASLRGGALLAAIVGLLAIPAGALAAAIVGGGHAAIYAVLLASGSAAVLLPALEEARIESDEALTVMAQVTIADVITILSVPIVLQPDRVGHAALASVLIVGCALVLVACARLVARGAWTQRVRRLSKSRRWALDLRLSLLVLFLLAWIAQESGTSVLIAGFAAGVLVAVLGGPKRLSTQTRGVADGFFVPLYFVVLGAGLDVGGLLRDPELLALVAALAALTVAIRLVAVRTVRVRPAAALASSAQLGVPAAIASLGLAEHVLSASIATAIVAAALISLAVATVGVERLAATSLTATISRSAPRS
ncbi:cation:proton antiporter [Conexibacter sp. CPCC 206217]|uniref:cation:proton antiporter n=1 Tax=Conexibacter sp. CPCC 206217 TaxID=3064574 RepID=UPI0027231914|nr:cation:proton antiporter [Conexibacter sp. CPCC 206217]MDO8213566.1 cation:proton antiporter [Conexibacter sp. CPCC 206217]